MTVLTVDFQVCFGLDVTTWQGLKNDTRRQKQLEKWNQRQRWQRRTLGHHFQPGSFLISRTVRCLSCWDNHRIFNKMLTYCRSNRSWRSWWPWRTVDLKTVTQTQEASFYSSKSWWTCEKTRCSLHAGLRTNDLPFVPFLLLLVHLWDPMTKKKHRKRQY